MPLGSGCKGAGRLRKSGNRRGVDHRNDDAERSDKLISGLEKVCRAPGYLIRRAHQFATAAYTAEFDSDVVTGVQFVALTAISEQPGLTGVNVAERIGYDKMTTSHVIRRLERKGFIERRQSEQDGREIRIWLTPAGRKAMEVVEARLWRVSDRLFAPLTMAERETLLAILEKLEAAARNG